MAAPKIPNGIILYHYPFSPYARRIVWYLQLRCIAYAQCLQPPVLPRPDVASLGVSYRRIPLASIGGSLYADTRLILAKLDELFPASATHPPLTPSGLSALLSSFTIEGPVFSRAATLIPTHLPVMKDPNFSRDRADFVSGPYSPAALDRMRPESLAHMRKVFDVYEALLADGRKWLADSPAPGMADLEGVWPLDWMAELRSVPLDLFGKERYPKTNAWMARWKEETAAAKKGAGKPVTVSGDVAAEFIIGAEKGKTVVESADPTGLKEGMEVLIFPTDTGAKHKDQGRLVGLSKDEVVIAVKTKTDPSKEIYLHAPRTGFRVVPAKDAARL